MFRNNCRDSTNWLLIIGLWLVTVSAVLGQQPGRPAKATAKRAAKTTRLRRVAIAPRALKPGFTKTGEVRKLSPDQLWDGKPDSLHTHRGPFRLLVYVGLGTSLYSAPLKTPGTLTDERQSRWGLPVSVRVMWQTDHRLRLGLETGFVNMYTYRGTVGGEAARVRVSAIPILAVFSMSVVKRFALYAGSGPYLVHSELSYDGLTKGSTFSLGWMVAGTYTQPLGKNIGIAAELKWYDASQTDDACFIAQATLVWRPITW